MENWKCDFQTSETVLGETESYSKYPRSCIHKRVDCALNYVKPNITFACYGINDGIYNPQSTERFNAYKSGIMKLIDKIKSAGSSLILLTPPPFDPAAIPQKVQPENAKEYSYKAPYYSYNSVLQDYVKWIMNLKINSIQSIDLNSRMLEYIKQKRVTRRKACFESGWYTPISA